ncbi:hypothetical protein [Arthrobacter sunyaminii]|uniref:hypothetical protein n=1 Tax=Arthrobacter sunyaminii TaxID=2816859 RepID=UPI001A93CF46|nr:hypothetical protein [Arthrobacter sunyaminii]MBO0895986.1 hypothetical protein [Arthrobacter sunyaminii]
MNKPRIILILTAILMSTGSLIALPAAADGGQERWKKGGIESGRWSQEPSTNVWTDSPVLGNDGYIYSFDLVCFKEDVGYLRCLDANSCEDGPGGQYVVWKRSARDVSPPIWEDFIGNGPACVYSENPEKLLEEVTSRLLSEFQEHPVAAGKVAAQPGPHTMIGAETNVYVDSQIQVINTEILGQNIKITATPTEYVLHYGDGSSSGLTFGPGSALPESRVGQPTATSHAYSSTGNFEMYATVYFTAVYSMNGGPEISIDGRGVFDTAPEPISVWKADSRNVADDCLVNPAGYGC